MQAYQVKLQVKLGRREGFKAFYRAGQRWDIGSTECDLVVVPDKELAKLPPADAAATLGGKTISGTQYQQLVDEPMLMVLEIRVDRVEVEAKKADAAPEKESAEDRLNKLVSAKKGK